MKKRIRVIPIILVIISVLIGVRLLLISVEIGKLNTSCTIMEDRLKESTINPWDNISLQYYNEDSIWLSCILQQKDANINRITTLYLLAISIFLTLLSWKIDKPKTT